MYSCHTEYKLQATTQESSIYDTTAKCSPQFDGLHVCTVRTARVDIPSPSQVAQVWVLPAKVGEARYSDMAYTPAATLAATMPCPADGNRLVK